MTKDRFTGPGRSPFNIASAIRWKNTSDEVIPAYACVKLSVYNEIDDYFEATKPDGSGNLHFVNGPASVAIDAFGGSQLWNHSRLGLTPSTTFGVGVGPVADSWEMEEGGSGFVVFSEPADGKAAILQIGGGGTVTEVRFMVVSSDPTTLTGLGEIRAWTYGFAREEIPASTLDHTVVEICDPSGCYLNEPSSELIGRMGVATYRDGIELGNCRSGTPPHPGVWEVSSLCCKMISCDVVI